MVATGVRVAVRTRPMSKKEEQLGSKCCVYINEAKAEVKIQDLKKKDSDSRQDEGGGVVGCSHLISHTVRIHSRIICTRNLDTPCCKGLW